MMPLEPRVNFGILADRLQRLVRLDTTVFDEVREDPSATVPSIVVVVVSTLLAAIGGWLWWNFQDFGFAGGVLLDSVVLGTVFSVALWIVWLLVAWVILGQLFHEQAELQEMLRTMGMAAAPLALSIGIFIPGISFGVGLASVALFFGLTTIAIQAAVPNASAARVLVANLAGFALWAIVGGLLVTSGDGLAPGIFLFDMPSEILSDFP